MKKLARLIEFKCDIESETDDIRNVSECRSFPKNKSIIKKVENCKPFVGISILFLLVSIVFSGIIIYIYLKFKNNVLPYQNSITNDLVF